MPVTSEGNIVVGGILASCYASFNHDVSHFAMKPILRFPGMVEWIIGMDIDAPGYVNVVKQMGRLFLPFSNLK